MSRPFRHEPNAYLAAGLSNLFEVLRVPAAVLEGVHNRIWDGTGWHVLHVEPGILDFEVQHGVELGRVRYNRSAMQRARRTRRAVLGTHAGWHDFFVPIVAGSEVSGVLAVGPFATARPTSPDVIERWRWLTGRQGHLADPEFAHFVAAMLAMLVFDAEQVRTFERFLNCLARIMAGEGNAQALMAEAASLRPELERSRRVERTWDAARSMIDERSARAWHSPQFDDSLKKLGLFAVPDRLVVGLLVPKSSELDPVDEALRRDAFQRACVELARDSGRVIAGQVGDYGVTFLSAVRGSSQRKHAGLIDLGERAAALARRRFGFALHVGASALSGPALPLSEQYREALRAAEFAASRGERLVQNAPDVSAGLFPLFELRRELGRLVNERPREVPARFERYLEAVALHSGYRMESARAHVEAGFDQIAGSVAQTKVLDERALSETSRELSDAAARARTVSELFAAYRRVIAELCQAVERPTATRHDKSLGRALAYIHRHYSEALERTTVARIAGFAPDYFSRLFKRRERVTFERYLRRLRIERAKQLLGNTDLGLARVAELSGFVTRQYLGHAFKAETRLTPLAYRRRQERRKRSGKSDKRNANR